jgi:RNA polymerase sigma-70 factor (ECF subfamily)
VTDANVESLGDRGETSTTLLIRVKAKDQEAWRRLVHLYSPLVHHWCQRSGLQEADTADVTQDVFRTVAESIDGFHHDQSGDSFRGWLRTVTRSRILDFLRRKARWTEGIGGSDAQIRWLEFPDDPEDASSSDEDERAILVRQVVDMVLGHCKEENRQAFLRVVVGGQHPVDVARDLGMTSNAVYLAKSHILRRIREEFAALVDV